MVFRVLAVLALSLAAGCGGESQPVGTGDDAVTSTSPPTNLYWVSPCAAKTPCAKSTSPLINLPLGDRAGATVYRGAEPKSRAELTFLASLGVVRVIDLQEGPWARLMEDVRTFGADVQLSVDHEKRIELVHAPIFELTTPKTERVDRVLALMRDAIAGGGAVYVHCALGRDRTGMIIALHRVINEGWAPADAYAEWKAHGFEATIVQKIEFHELDEYFRDRTGFKG
jgi:Polymorphic toxin system, DSP-PTPase phosphatase